MTDGPLVRFNPSYARPFIISLRALDNSTTKEVIEQLRKDCAQALATMRRRLKTREQLKPTTEADA